MNDIGSTPFGVPWCFYDWARGVKTPIPVLPAMVVDLMVVLFDRRSVATIFLRVMFFFCFIPFWLVGSKWIRYLLDMLPFMFLMAGCALEICFRRCSAVAIRSRR